MMEAAAVSLQVGDQGCGGGGKTKLGEVGGSLELLGWVFFVCHTPHFTLTNPHNQGDPTLGLHHMAITILVMGPVPLN